MPTIAELVARHSKVAGDIKICMPHAEDIWFIPYFEASRTSIAGKVYWWHGIDCNGKYDQFVGDSHQWQLYVEPKPTVMRAQYLVESTLPDGVVPRQTNIYALDETEARKYAGYPSCYKFTRLEERAFDRYCNTIKTQKVS